MTLRLGFNLDGPERQRMEEPPVLNIIPRDRMPTLSLCNIALSGLNSFIQLVLSIVCSNKNSHLIDNPRLIPGIRRSIETLGNRGHQVHSYPLMNLLKRTPSVTFAHETHLLPYETSNFSSIAARPFNRFLSIPIIVKGVFGNHIAHILVDKEKNLIEFFDSKGLTLNHPNNIRAKKMVEALNKKFPAYAIFEHTKQRQFDGHSCGVFVIWHLRQRVIQNIAPENIPDQVDIEEFRDTLAEELAR